MAEFYLKHAIGVEDGTKNPPEKYDAREVGAKKKIIKTDHPAGVAYASGDRLFLASLKAGEQISDIKIVTDTTLGSTTLSIGPTGTAAKYASAKTLTVVDVPTSIGPRASAADDGPLTADEDVWITLGVGGIAGAVLFSVYVEVISLA